MAHHWPRELLYSHSTVFGLDGTYDYIIPNSINSLLIAQDIFLMAQTLTKCTCNVDPIWPILQISASHIIITKVNKDNRGIYNDYNLHVQLYNHHWNDNYNQDRPWDSQTFTTLHVS